VGGTSAAARAAYENRAARPSDNSRSATTIEREATRLAAMIAACRKPSAMAKRFRKTLSSIAIGQLPTFRAASFRRRCPHARAHSLPSCLGRRRGNQASNCAQSLESRAKDNLPKRQQDYRYDNGAIIIEDADQGSIPRAGFFFFPFPVICRARQHGGVEAPSPPGEWLGKARKSPRRRSPRHDKAELVSSGTSTYIASCAERDRRCRWRSAAGRQRAALQRHRPRPAADLRGWVQTRPHRPPGLHVSRTRHAV